MSKMREIHSRVKGKWMRYAPELYWGDELDVRFYLISQLKKLHNKKILDVGCGIGIILSELDKSNKKFGLDNSKRALDIARKMSADAKFVSGDICSLPLKEGEFDVVIAANVLPGYDYAYKNRPVALKKMIKEISRVLKKNGRMFLTTPNGEHGYYKNKDKIKINELSSLLERNFNFKIYGYDPLPKFMPPKIWIKMPGIHGILNSLLQKEYFKRKGRAFYVEGVKK